MGARTLPSLVELIMNARCSVTGSVCENTAFPSYLLSGKSRVMLLLTEHREGCNYTHVTGRGSGSESTVVKAVLNPSWIK